MTFSRAALDQLAQDYADAWKSKIPGKIAAFHNATSSIIINSGEPSSGHKGVTEMAASFHKDVPDMMLTSDGIRAAGNHVVFMWTFIGHHAGTGNPLHISGWEEWDLDENMKVNSSLGWFDGDEYQQQIDG